MGACTSAAPRPSRSTEAPVVDVGSGNAGSGPSASPSRDGVTEPGAPHSGGADAMLVWETSVSEAQARARRQRRPMLVYLRADWSAAALELDRGVWSDPRVLRAARGFVALKLDLSAAEGDAELYAQHFGVRAVPTTVVLDAAGKQVGMLAGAFEAEDLLPVLAKADEETP